MELIIKEAHNTIAKSSSHCLIGNIVLDRVLDRKYIECIIQKMWHCNVKMTEIKGNIFIFYFDKAEDCYRVLRDIPWTVQGGLIILSPLFSRNISSELPLFSSPFWVQVHGLPLQFCTEHNAFNIGQYLGEYLCVDKSVDWRNFLRIRVKFDVRNPLITGFWLSEPHVWIHFKYEKLGSFCYKCGRIGHHRNICRFPPAGNENFGPWLRVDTFSNRSIKMDNNMTMVKNPSAGFTLIRSPKLLSWPNLEVQQHQDNLENTPPENLWARLIINGVDSILMMVNCALIRSRVAKENVVEGYGWLLLMIIAYFFYLVLKFGVIIRRCHFFKKSNGTGENTRAEYNPVTQLKDLFILLVFCVTFLVSC